MSMKYPIITNITKKTTLLVLLSLVFLLSACKKESNQVLDETTLSSNDIISSNNSISSDSISINNTISQNEAGTESEKIFASELLPNEKNSIQIGQLSKEHIYYQEVVDLDPECAQYIQELTIYDQEINDTFVVHISLPKDYNEKSKYPMVLMTDGVWRLSDHPEFRQYMLEGTMKESIVVSVGYPNDYDYFKIRERDLLEDPESYLHFIVDNLVPYLQETYSIDAADLTLTGHSYGGYWAFYALFNSDTIGKNTFRNYYIGSPSFQASTNGKYIRDFEKKYYERSHKLANNVYVTVGGLEQPGFQKPIETFTNFMKNRNYEELNLKYEVIEDYDHNTVFKPSIKNAFVWFYDSDDEK